MFFLRFAVIAATLAVCKILAGVSSVACVVQDVGLFNVFGRSSKWNAKEDEALLNAVEQYGFGSW